MEFLKNIAVMDLETTGVDAKECAVLSIGHTFLWKSINFGQKSLSSQRWLNSDVATKSAFPGMSLLVAIACVCKRIARFIALTKSIYAGKIYRLLLEFPPRLKSWVSFGVKL